MLVSILRGADIASHGHKAPTTPSLPKPGLTYLTYSGGHARSTLKSIDVGGDVPAIMGSVPSR